jgi:hypothetical protein
VSEKYRKVIEDERKKGASNRQRRKALKQTETTPQQENAEEKA